MREVWYYSNGRTRVGPLSKEDLVEALSLMPEPEKIFVWRNGLSDWREAAELPELTAYVSKPPPLPLSDELPIRATPTQRAATKQEAAHGSGVLHALFSFKGRLNRTQYSLTFIFGYLGPLIATAVIGDDLDKGPQYLQIIFWALIVWMFWVFFASNAKRLHDLDMPGAYSLFVIVPAVGLLGMLYLLFARGNPDNNQYGAPP